MGKFPQFGSLVKRVRLALRMDKVAFAHFLGASPRAVEKWEGGDNRPSRGSLKQMAGAVRGALQEEVEEALKYDWHPKGVQESGREEIVGLAELLPEGLWDEINERAKKQRKLLARVCADLLESGLHAEVEEMAEKLHADRAASTRRRKQAS